MVRSFLSMRLSVRSLFRAIALILTLAGCSGQQQVKPALPIAAVRTATMNITPGVEVLARLAMPDGFVPLPDYPPLWLEAGEEVAVAGAREGHTVVMGYGGKGYRDSRIIAEDGGVGAPDGSIVDLAPSPDGMALALAVVSAKEPRLDVVTRDLISAGAANPVSTFDGEFESASLGWLGGLTIPVALRAKPQNATGKTDGGPSDRSESTAALASSGLYVINISGVVTTGYLKLDCKMSRLSWSPQGIVAAATGDANTPPVLIDREKESCERINARAPLRILDWAHDSKSFLFEDSNPAIGTGIYRYDIASKTARLVAISSGAAVFVGNDDVLALGNSALTFRGAQFKPDGGIRAEVARSNPSGTNVEVESLGFYTTPAMLATSTMTYTRATDAAAIATFSPTTEGPMRKIVIYSVAPKRAFLVAFGAVRGVVAMSWSPRGRYLAIADGDGSAAALTIISPPR